MDKSLFSVFKKSLLILFCLSFSGCYLFTSHDPQIPEDIKALCSEYNNGWNLGNTLDANYTGSGTDNTGLSTEIYWGMPYTTNEMIKAIAAQGFKTIRIPVSWHNHITDRSTYSIDQQWMNRVKQIVDWSLDAGVKVIINIHHDNLTESGMKNNAGFCISSNSTYISNSKNYINSIWKQISETFADYDNRLIFELLNEPRDVGSSYEWNAGAGDYQKLLNANRLIMEYEQQALNTIRSSGGKNSERYIMVPPYAASPNMMSGWSLPEDSAENRLILSVHAYTPYEFAMSTSAVKVFGSSQKSAIDFLFSGLRKEYILKGIPVIIGEASASDKENTDQRKKWVDYYYGKAREASIPVMLWDNMVTASNGGNIDSGECHGYFNRSKCSWFFPVLVDAMVNQ